MKVTPSVGCVKYKAQHIVLAVRIPVLMRGKWPGGAKNGGFGCGFSRKGAKLVEFLRGLLVSNRASFEGRRGGGEGQGAGVVQIGVDGGGNVGKVAGNHQNWVPPLRDGFIVDKVGHRAQARSALFSQPQTPGCPILSRLLRKGGT